MIGDFAPTTVGAKWVYSYYYLSTDLMGSFRIMDSLTVSITVSSKILRGNDTVIVLSVLEQGSKLSNYPGEGTDTTGVWNYTDTAIASGDSVVKHAPYHCPVFPFFTYHTITEDSLKKVLLGNDSISCYCHYDPVCMEYEYHETYYYYQNIGEYSYYECGSPPGMGVLRYQINLISFSNGNFSVAAKPIVNKPTARPAVSFRHAVIILDGKNMRKDGMYYDVRGKRISAGQRLYHGILLEKIGNP
jgi:hypothetical protein